MNPKFLCANHRQWLTSDTHRAELFWLDWMEQGCALYDNGQFQQATPFLGCAFELADYLLAESWPSYTLAAQRFTHSTLHLMEAYRRRGDSGMSSFLLVGASSRLARELERNRACAVTASCLEALYQLDAPHLAASSGVARYSLH